MITIPVTRDDEIIDQPQDLRALVWLTAKAQGQGGRSLTVSIRSLGREMGIGEGAARCSLRRLYRQGYIDLVAGKGRAPSVATIRSERRRS